jgi:hypothetical protein
VTVSVYLQLLASIDTILDGTSVVFIFCPPLGTTCISRETVLFTGLHHHFLSLHQNVTFSETSAECSSLETIRGWTPYRFQSPNPSKANAALSCLLPLPRATKRMRLDGWLSYKLREAPGCNNTFC